MGRFTGVLGLLTMLGLAYTFSTNRRAINRKTVAWGLGLQILFAIFVLVDLRESTNTNHNACNSVFLQAYKPFQAPQRQEQ